MENQEQTIAELQQTITDLRKSIEQKQSDYVYAKKKEDDANKQMYSAISNAIDCLRAVRAMLKHTPQGATHKMRDFYRDAIVSYINETIDVMEIAKDPYPF